MAKNKKTNFAMTPELQKFQFEVAQELGLSMNAAKVEPASSKKQTKTK